MTVFQYLNRDEYSEFVCGCGAAIVNISITFPINKVIFRQMLHGVALKHATNQLFSEGFSTLYRGIGPPLLQKAISTSLMFGTYDAIQRPLANSNMNPNLSKAIAAMMAGTAEATLTPFERVQTLLQDNHYNKQFINMRHVIKVIATEYSATEFYRGFIPVLLRNGPSNVSFFIFRETASTYVIIPPNTWFGFKIFKEFFIGASIGALNSTLFYPCNVLKVHMQSSLGGPFKSVKRAAIEIYKERGHRISYFYRGVHMNCTRSFVSWGIVNVAYENLRLVIKSN
ncbi:mitochondrial nicotinamide adenine dinucleotide transporter SLC25A51 [Daktulosphaira vitifoliae]|uniref:mitochondrial nicotinamide adenine dinucleotide transporter SLC25A51 n=1 Tax=Daktulosphaira vitifoliae TaxID=58002 RepID=UPI0021AAC564|nr:mitochondrial nicotinamide adenine dinucleotide transporter SLC25A51 [Daktulosphaira vitifoliae]XP_050520865.1 mitochondrial nicotinamide adenine dinucleotide transporter SLC25A51 [Daktulosphaira vitifoliae]